MMQSLTFYLLLASSFPDHPFHFCLIMLGGSLLLKKGFPKAMEQNTLWCAEPYHGCTVEEPKHLQ